MKYEIKGTPLPVVVCQLDEGESMITQKGGMSWMSPNMKMETNAGGNVGKTLSRMFSGESIFQNIYTANGGSGEIAFASSFPGEIFPWEVKGGTSFIAQKGAFLASEKGVNMEICFQKKIGAGFFGGEGFVMQRFTGEGMVFLEIDGSMVMYTLAAGQSMVVNTGYVACMEDSVTLDIETVKGLGNKMFGGEGFFNTKVTGPGRVWLQTMPASQIAGVIQPFLMHGNSN